MVFNGNCRCRQRWMRACSCAMKMNTSSARVSSLPHLEKPSMNCARIPWYETRSVTLSTRAFLKRKALSGWITADMSMPGSLNGTYLYFSVQLEDEERWCSAFAAFFMEAILEDEKLSRNLVLFLCQLMKYRASSANLRTRCVYNVMWCYCLPRRPVLFSNLPGHKQ